MNKQEMPKMPFRESKFPAFEKGGT